MPSDPTRPTDRLTGHALRNAHLCQRSLARAETAPPLARAIVRIRVEALGMTRLELARRSGLSRGTLRDLELGIHTPTRRIVQRLVDFCRREGVGAGLLDELCRLYAGPADTLARFLARLELRAGSPAELARRVGISPTTLWEYRRGHFPLPLDLLRRLCQAVGEDPAPGEALWLISERQRFLERDYPPALAEFWALCGRQGYTERRLLILGLGTAAVRRLRYLELPPWPDVEGVARELCRDEGEREALKKLWLHDLRAQRAHLADGFGAGLKHLRQKQGVSRRALADLFGIGGRKPARILKHVEEDGFYSAQAYPAGLVAVLAGGTPEAARLLELWRRRRQRFHLRHRPETRTDLRLARELYGFGPADMEPVLGYSNLEYQRIERGVSPLRETARDRILDAIHQAGRRRVEALLRHRGVREAEGRAWQAPASVRALVASLARREGGLIPLARSLKKAGLKGFWPAWLRDIARGQKVPPWTVLERIGLACGVPDLSEARRDWEDRYRAWLKGWCPSPLGVEVRLLIAEVAPTARAFSPRLGFHYSVLVRNLQRMDRDEPVRWLCVERVLRAAGLAAEGPRWKEIHALWYTAGARRKTSSFNRTWGLPLAEPRG